MEEIKEGAADHSVMRQPGDKDMHELFVAVLLDHHIYDRTALSRGAAAVRGPATGHQAAYTKKLQQLLSPLSLSLTSSSFFVFFFCDSLCVGAQFGAFCVRLILPFACPRVIDVLFYEEADARSAVDFPYICVAMVVYLSHEFVLYWCECSSHKSLCSSHETSAL